MHRPADVCRALLAALEAAEGRRRSRKRDQTPDAFGLSVKRDLLQQVVAADPDAQTFEAWLMAYPETCDRPELAGPARAMARAVFDDWRLAHNSEEFMRWLDDGAPSADVQERDRAARNTVAAVVLAGGRSSRMGEAKALLRFDGRPLIAHLVDRLRAMFEEIVVVAAPDQPLPALDATVVRDEVAFQGPVAGLCYGLSAITREVGFVTACDAAFLNPMLIGYLISELGTHDVVVPHWEGRAQPLHAVYRASVVPHLQRQLARGELRPVTLFDRVRTRHVSEDEVRSVDADGWSFFNMNSPEDYARALDHWRTVQQSAIRR